MTHHRYTLLAETEVVKMVLSDRHCPFAKANR